MITVLIFVSIALDAFMQSRDVVSENRLNLSNHDVLRAMFMFYQHSIFQRGLR